MLAGTTVCKNVSTCAAQQLPSEGAIREEERRLCYKRLKERLFHLGGELGKAMPVRLGHLDPKKQVT